MLCCVVLSQLPDDFAFFSQWMKPGLEAELCAIPSLEIPRISYAEALKLLQEEAPAGSAVRGIEWGDDLGREQERFLTDVVFGGKPVRQDRGESVVHFLFYCQQRSLGDGHILCLPLWGHSASCTIFQPP